MVVVCWCGRSSRPGIVTDRHSALFKTLKPLIAPRSAHTVLPVCLVKQLKCLCKILPSLQQNFTHTHTHPHTHARARARARSSNSFIVTLSLIRRTACARAQFSGCSSTTNAHSETGQMAVCSQNLTLGALISRSALSVLVGALFKKFGLFLNTPRTLKRQTAFASFIFLFALDLPNFKIESTHFKEKLSLFGRLLDNILQDCLLSSLRLHAHLFHGNSVVERY